VDRDRTTQDKKKEYTTLTTHHSPLTDHIHKQHHRTPSHHITSQPRMMNIHKGNNCGNHSASASARSRTTTSHTTSNSGGEPQLQQQQQLQPPQLGYQLEYSAGSHGKTFSATKRRIRFKFGFASEHALRDPTLVGEDCRSRERSSTTSSSRSPPDCNNHVNHVDEHEVTLVWSIASGKRLILCNGQEMHFSATQPCCLTAPSSVSVSSITSAMPRLLFLLPEQKFEHSWEIMTSQGRCHSITIVAHATPLKGLGSSAANHGLSSIHTPSSLSQSAQSQTASHSSAPFRQFDLLVDGRSYFDMPHVLELGVSERGGGMLPARLRAKQQLQFAAKTMVRMPSPDNYMYRSNGNTSNTNNNNNHYSSSSMLNRSALLGLPSPTSASATATATLLSCPGHTHTHTPPTNMRPQSHSHSHSHTTTSTVTTSSTCGSGGEGGEIEIVSTGAQHAPHPRHSAAAAAAVAGTTTTATACNANATPKHRSRSNSSRNNSNSNNHTHIRILQDEDVEQDFLFGESVMSCIDNEHEHQANNAAATNANVAIMRKPQPQTIFTLGNSTSNMNANHRSPPPASISSVKSWGTDSTAESFSPTTNTTGKINGHGIGHANLSSPNNGGRQNRKHHFLSPPRTAIATSPSPAQHHQLPQYQYQRRPPLRTIDVNTIHTKNNSNSNHTNSNKIMAKQQAVLPVLNVHHLNLNANVIVTGPDHALKHQGSTTPQYEYPAFAALHSTSISSHDRDHDHGGYPAAVGMDRNPHTHIHSIHDTPSQPSGGGSGGGGVDHQANSSLRVGLC
jgi:hypothetical protein